MLHNGRLQKTESCHKVGAYHIYPRNCSLITEISVLFDTVSFMISTELLGIFTHMFNFCWMPEDKVLNSGSLEYETTNINCSLYENLLSRFCFM